MASGRLFLTPSKFFYLAIFALCLVTTLSIVTTPLNGDVKIFFASAHFAEIQYGGGLLGVLQSWELKPIGNRLWIYWFYQIATCFVEFKDTVAFERAVLAIYFFHIAVFSVFVGICSSQEISNYLKRNVSPATIAAYVFSVFLFSAHTNHLQAEASALLLTLLGTSLLLRQGSKKWGLFADILASIVFTFVFYIKLVTGAFVVAGALFVMLVKPQRRLYRVGMFTFTLCVGVLIGLKVFYPTEIVEWSNAALYQKSGVGLNFKRLWAVPFYFYVRYSITTNFLYLITLIVTPIILYTCYRQNRKRDALICLFLAIFCMLPAIVQVKWFSNHYLPMIIFATALILLSLRFDVGRKSLIVSLVAGLMLSVLLHSYVSLSMPNVVMNTLWNNSNGHWTWPMSHRYRGLWQTQLSTNKLIDSIKTQKNKVLYLDNGVSAYYLGNPTFLKHFFPLPLQRIRHYESDDNKLLDSAVYKKSLEQLLSWNGDFVVCSGWFGLENFPKFVAMLQEKYTKYEIHEKRGEMSVDLSIYVNKNLFQTEAL